MRFLARRAVQLTSCRLVKIATPKQHFIAMACDSESRAMILWCVMSMKLNIGKKIGGLKMMTLHREKDLACHQTYRIDV